VNGFFFPGGGSAFPPAAQRTFEKVVESNKNGNYLPLLGTCMGFQWLLIAATKDSNILDPKSGQMDSYNYSIPLNFTSAAFKSRTFSKASTTVMKNLEYLNVTMNNHHYGIWTDHFKSDPTLSSFFNLLSNNNDRNGHEFVSTIESSQYPIYGTQWHPEKNQFE
jgi:gamma-glutamyl hydrolase